MSEFLFPELPLETPASAPARKVKSTLTHEEVCQKVASMIKNKQADLLEQFLVDHPPQRAIKCEGEKVHLYALNHFDEQVFGVLRKHIKMPFAQNNLFGLLMSNDRPKTFAVAQCMDMTGTMGSNVLWSVANANPSASVASLALDMVEAFAPPLVLDGGVKNLKETGFNSYTFSWYLKKAVSEKNEKLTNRLINVLNAPEVKKESLQWFMYQVFSMWPYHDLSFLVPKIHARTSLSLAWKGCFPFRIRGAVLDSEFNSRSFYVHKEIHLNNFLEMVLARGGRSIAEVVRHKEGRDEVLKALNSNPGLAYSFLNETPNADLLPIMKNLMPDLLNWKNDFGYNIAFVWMAASRTKSVAHHLVSLCPDLLQESCHGANALSFLNETDQAEIDKKLLRSVLHKKKLGLVSKAGKTRAPRRL